VKSFIINGSIFPKKFRKKIAIALHKGDKYVCPFCGYSSKDLFPRGHDVPVLMEKQVVGAGTRESVCYKCNSMARERLIYVYLRDKLKIFLNTDKAILHIAPEIILSQKLLEFGFKEYVCGDLFLEGYKYPKHVTNINVLNIPYPANRFDLIICNHVLEHIPNDLDAMKEIYRVLKTNGQAILQVPISKNSLHTYEDFSIVDPVQREKIFGQFDHVRRYGQDYVNRLEGCGFKVTRINIYDEFAGYGLNKDEDIFVYEKIAL
jgi:SAM-dependent methyltransferase